MGVAYTQCSCDVGLGTKINMIKQNLECSLTLTSISNLCLGDDGF